ncbi:MAG: DUF2339 domain-containing protein [Acidobacteria bacterium]|nr:DUF2339 domain-containing protein [Acidobacteriota bacterium]
MPFVFLLACGALVAAIVALNRVRELADRLARLEEDNARLVSELRRAKVAEAPAPPPPPFVPPAVPVPVPVAHDLPPRIERAEPPEQQQPLTAVEAAPPPPPPPLPAPAPASRIDWEGFVGVKLFSWAAGLALAVAGLTFAKYAVDSGMLGPGLRFLLGLLAGVGLLVVCELKVARRYAPTANALDAGGLVILFATLYAGYATWNLIGPVTAFFGLAGVTALAVSLSVRRDSVFIALLGLFGGFLTPALLSTGADRPLSLFSYLLVLNLGLAHVAHRKGFSPLVVLALVFTTLYQWGWVAKFLTVEKLPLALVIFLIFPVSAVISLTLRERSGAEVAPAARKSAAVSAALPALFAFFVAVVPDYGGQYTLLFGFTTVLAIALFAVAWRRGPHLLHVVGAASSVLVTWVWLVASFRATAYPDIVFWILGLGCVAALAPLVAHRAGPPLGEDGEAGAWAVPFLVLSLLVVVGREPAGLSTALVLSVVLGMLAAAEVHVLSRRRARAFLPFTFVFAGLVATAGAYFDHTTSIRSVLFAVLFAGLGWAFHETARQRHLPREPFVDGTVAALLLSQLVLLVAAGRDGMVPATMTIFALGISVALLHLAFREERPYVPIGAIPLGFLGVLVFSAQAAYPVTVLAGLPLGLFTVFLGSAAAVGLRGHPALGHHVAAVFASVPAFLLVREAFQHHGLSALGGPAALLFAAALGLVAYALSREEGGLESPRFAWAAGGSLSWLVAAVPIALDREALTITWALMAAALAWLYVKVRRRGLLVFVLGLSVAVFLRLGVVLLEPSALAIGPVGPGLFNAYLYTYLVSAGALFLAGWLLREEADPLPPFRLPMLLPGLGAVLLFVLVNVEIAHTFSSGGALRFRFASENLGEGLAYTLGWAVFAIALLVAGIARDLRPVRVAAVVLLSVTLLKGFLMDLGRLGGLYRVAAFVGLAFSAAAVAVLLQRFVLKRNEEKPES